MGGGARGGDESAVGPGKRGGREGRLRTWQSARAQVSRAPRESARHLAEKRAKRRGATPCPCLGASRGPVGLNAQTPLPASSEGTAEREMCCGLPLRCGGMRPIQGGQERGQGVQVQRAQRGGGVWLESAAGKGVAALDTCYSIQGASSTRPSTSDSDSTKARRGARRGILDASRRARPSLRPRPTTTTWATVRRLLSRKGGLLLREDDADLGGAEEALLDHVCGRKARDVVQRLREGSRHNVETGSRR